MSAGVQNETYWGNKMRLDQREYFPRISGQRFCVGLGGWDTTQNWVWGWWMRVTVWRAVALIGQLRPRKSIWWSALTRRRKCRARWRSNRLGSGQGRSTV